MIKIDKKIEGLPETVDSITIYEQDWAESGKNMFDSGVMHVLLFERECFCSKMVCGSSNIVMSLH